MPAALPIIQAAGSLLGIFGGGPDYKAQYDQEERLQGLHMRGTKEMMKYSQEQQMKMLNDTSYKWQVSKMREAGINPALMYGMGGGGGATTGSANGATGGSHGAQAGPKPMGVMLDKALMMGQIAMQKAQTENIKADTANKTASATNTEANTEVQRMEAIIKDAAGKLGMREWKMKEPLTDIEQKTMEDELSARQGVAGTIYEMWISGKLNEEALGKVEAIAKQNAKTDADRRRVEQEIDNLKANLKGINLANELSEIELKLQKETGIDRNSPWYLKMFGRLFGHLLR